MNVLSLIGFFIGMLCTASILAKLYAHIDVSGGMFMVATFGWTLFVARWIL